MGAAKTVWKDAEYAGLAERSYVDHVDAFKPDGSHAAEQQRQFFAGETRNPSFLYPQLKPVHEYASLADELGTVLSGWRDTSPLGNLYYALLSERRRSLMLCIDACNPGLGLFKTDNAVLWGKPRDDIFASIVADLRRRARSTVDKGAKAVEEAKALLDRLEPMPDGPILLPTKEQFETCKQLMLSVLENLHLPDDYPTDGYWDGPMMAEVLNKMFAAAEPNNWVARLVNDQKRISVHRDLEEVRIPRGRKLAARKAKETCGHEGLHAYRAMRGKATGYYIMYMGTAGVLVAEEGCTTALTQAMKGSITRHSSEELYLATSLSCGLDGTLRDFRDVYEAMVVYFQYSSAKASEATKSAESPQERSWNVALRVFRGTTCDIPGVYYGAGTAYAEGNLEVWNLLGDKPERVAYISAGKFSPFGDFDVDNLVAAEIIPML